MVRSFHYAVEAVLYHKAVPGDSSGEVEITEVLVGELIYILYSNAASYNSFCGSMVVSHGAIYEPDPIEQDRTLRVFRFPTKSS